jgi:hypothetical protein
MSSKKACITASIVFLVLLIFSLVIGSFFYKNTTMLEQGTIASKETIVGTTAAAVQVRISHLINTASSMASNGDIVADVASGQWGNAANVSRDLQNNPDYYDTYIDRIILIDPHGVEQAAYPELVGGVGASFSNNAYFQKILGGAPYAVSNVTLRSSQPQIDIVNVFVPVSTKGKTIGVIGFQIPTRNFLEFGSDASLGTYGFTYIIDTAGNIVASPRLSSEEGSIANVASTSIAQKVLSGYAGSDESYSAIDNEKNVTTYAPVPLYKWGVVLQEPYNEVFGNAENIFQAVEFGLIAFIVLDFVVSYLVFRSLNKKENE